MPLGHQPPDVLAMVVARVVHQDLTTQRFFIRETYHALGAASFPFVQPAVVVYVALTDGRGLTRLKLSLVDVDEASPPLYETEATVEFKDPLAVVEMVFSQQNVVFPSSGEYRLQLFVGNELLRERRLYVLAVDGTEFQ